MKARAERSESWAGQGSGRMSCTARGGRGCHGALFGGIVFERRRKHSSGQVQAILLGWGSPQYFFGFVSPAKSLTGPHCPLGTGTWQNLLPWPMGLVCVRPGCERKDLSTLKEFVNLRPSKASLSHAQRPRPFLSVQPIPFMGSKQ